ncbi:hypothetical protein KC686_02315, partial [Candidatus Woesebacteria bacterium]|nr:hypothetical protein [Candidatus Woesebacteria bacterium]
GIPLNILGITPRGFSPFHWLWYAVLGIWKLLTNWERYEAYVVEMGIDSPHPPKNMGYLLSIVQPNVGVFLNAGPTHAENFDSLLPSANTNNAEYLQDITKLIAGEKGKLIEQLPSTGVAILNANDRNVMTTAKKTNAHVKTFGTSKKSDIVLTKHTINLEGTQLTVSYQSKTYQLHFPHFLIPKQTTYSLMAALLVGITQDVSIQTSVTNLQKKFQLPRSRSTLLAGINDSHIIDSSYNSSLAPALDMLDTLQISKGRKLALLGDMRELGASTPAEHEILAKKAAKLCDEVYLVGPLTKQHMLPILESAAIPTMWFATAGEAGKYLKTQLQKDDVLLVKASQNTLFLEIAVQMLMAEPEKADEVLCRRGEFWDKQR